MRQVASEPELPLTVMATFASDSALTLNYRGSCYRGGVRHDNLQDYMDTINNSFGLMNELRAITQQLVDLGKKRILMKVRLTIFIGESLEVIIIGRGGGRTGVMIPTSKLSS